ncbi:MAG: hypothetical protein LBM68_00465 [Bacteroidales bacterium]|jgi:hypothetical protein|nr:hypothetical protein [Bacteroidales bacterium]
MKVEEKYNRKLLVEGKDDQHVMWALCEKFNIPEEFDVIDCEGIDNLFESIPVRFKESGIQAIGIIIDADTDIQNRWISVRNLLVNQGFVIPENLPKNGLIISNGKVKVGVWIMPSNDTNGMLEDFVSFLIPPTDELLPIVDATLNEIESKKLNKYALSHKSKARIYSWLSWQETHGIPMGQSITKQYLTTDNENCKQLIHWLQELFVE